MEILVPHICAHCKKKMRTEVRGIWLAPGNVLDKDLVKVPGKELGQWLHRSCYIGYFEAIDKQHAVK